MRENGFTLIELLVVLAILGLLMAVIPPFLTGGQARAQFKQAARDIAAGLRETRSLAIARGRAEVFAVDIDQGSFRAGETGKLHRVAGDIRLTLVTTTQEQIDQKAGGIRFFPDGSSTGGGVRLARGGRHYDILVDWLTGRISSDETVAQPGG